MQPQIKPVMKYSLFLLTAAFLFLTSCNKNSESSNFYKNVDLSANPCSYITKQMILCHFGVSTSKLELKNVNTQSDNNKSQCGYFWEKSDVEETQSGNNHSASTSNHIKIGNFRKYNDEIAAVRDFKRNYWISSNEHTTERNSDMNSRNHSILDESFRTMHDGLQREYNTDFKLTEVFGVGDQAFYDHLNKSLDVRFGTFSFSVFIETEYDTETNILIAKKLAREVWEKL